MCKLRPPLAVQSDGERPVSDDPRTWGRNPERLQWEVFPVDKKGKQCGSSVYVAADNQERALACGKYWRRMLSMKPAKNVAARRYHPERDPYMVACGFVAPAKGF
jgi:hypothetical protein